jgi:hypothetical protein
MFDWLFENQWIIYMVVAYIAFKLGWKAHEAYVLYIIHEHPERMELATKVSKAIKDMPDDQALSLVRRVRTYQTDIVKLNIESADGVMYAYNLGEFVAQGSSLEEILDKAKKRFPNTEFLAEKDSQLSPNNL